MAPRSTPAVSLIDVLPHLRADVAALAPHAHEEQYSSRAALMLPGAEVDPERLPVAIVVGGARPAGFFVLHAGAGAQPVAGPDDVLIRGFFVDAEAQGRGIARAALALLPGFVRERFPSARRVVLTVNTENTRALRVYLAAGFVDTGELVLGGILGPQHVLELDLALR